MKKINFFLALLVFLQCNTESKQEIQAAVVSARIEASEAGKTIMMQGGNAYDAMVATSFALTVVYPVAGNITGGGFFVYRTAAGETGTLDYREIAPLKATKDLFLDDKGNVIPKLSTLGGLAVGIPGAVAGILEVHRKMGSLPLKQLLAPAIKLAEEGYIVTEKQAQSFKRYRDLFIEVNGEDTFFAQEHKAGDRIVNLPLARTLKAIAAKGNAGFYEGWVAEAMVNKTQATGGILSLEDLKVYEPKWRDPIQFSYKDLNVISMAPPSSGGICLSQMMQMVAPYNLKNMGHNSTESMHLMIEAERRSYADRSHFLGDPDFVSVPQAHLIDPSYIAERMQNYSADNATLSKDVSHGDIIVVESDETTHFSIIDKEGNAVSVTTTLNGAYGSKVYVDEIGVFMNNEMDDFSSKPGVPNMFGLTGSEANSIAPKKRMLSSMTPTIIEKNNQLYMVVGTPGGSTIITSVFQAILNVYEHGMGMQEAVAAPRFHHQWLPDEVVLEPGAFEEDVIQKLKDKGHTIETKHNRIIGKVDAILIDNGNMSVGADPRGDDAAATF
ncbi:MAG: gamma-glutamyltransferase [Flavobacteriaceae bacterium]|nr:gamma-glutamyltransferase [Flavobacteriaceae bacterium]